MSGTSERGRAARRGYGGRWLARSPLLLAALLAGCSRQFRLFHPAGPVARASLGFTIVDVAIMLVIIVPTGLFVAFSIWRYRVTRNARFDANFTHSSVFEVLMWGVPLTAVIALGYFSWQGVFRVNPYAPTVLTHPLSLAKPPPRPGRSHPLVINVVATDWQWLFIYPGQRIATLNTLYVPAGRNIEFRLTATDVVNDFFIPQLLGMIDVMPGMRTRDAMRADHPGVWTGFSADISGAGFSWMRFKTHVLAPDRFNTWVATTQAAPDHLSYARFEAVARPTINLKPAPAYFSAVDPHLFSRIVRAAMDGKTYQTPIFLTKDMKQNQTDHAGYLTGYSHS